MTQIIMAIALLCGNPGYGSLNSDEVLACQKYYIHCVKEGPSMVYDLNLSKCVFDKQKLGGPK